jgi:hypothetical protein
LAFSDKMGGPAISRRFLIQQKTVRKAVGMKRWPDLNASAGDGQDRTSYQAWIVDHGIVTDAGQDNPRGAGEPFASGPSVRFGRDKSINL